MVISFGVCSPTIYPINEIYTQIFFQSPLLQYVCMKIVVIVLLIASAILVCGCTTLAPTAAPGTTPGTSIVVPVEKTIPNLIGVWSGNATGHTKVEGFAINLPVTFNISAQKGQAFSGRKEYLRGDGKTYYENFSGFITLTGEIYESDDVKGFSIGRLTGPDSMDLNYLEDGPDTKAYFFSLIRKKS